MQHDPAVISACPQACKEVASRYPNIEYTEMIVDNTLTKTKVTVLICHFYLPAGLQGGCVPLPQHRVHRDDC
jgi:hypothetical protein